MFFPILILYPLYTFSSFKVNYKDWNTAPRVFKHTFAKNQFQCRVDAKAVYRCSNLINWYQISKLCTVNIILSKYLNVLSFFDLQKRLKNLNKSSHKTIKTNTRPKKSSPIKNETKIDLLTNSQDKMTPVDTFRSDDRTV